MDWRTLERERVRLHPEQVRYPTWQCHRHGRGDLKIKDRGKLSSTERQHLHRFVINAAKSPPASPASPARGNVNHVIVVCPLHWPDIEDCSESCDARFEFRRAAQALSQYWHERSRGRKPLRPRSLRGHRTTRRAA